MTREDAIKELQESLDTLREYDIAHSSRLKQALEMAIRTLENHDIFMKRSYSQGKQDALSQEPCDDAISRVEALKIAVTEYELKKIRELPSVTLKSETVTEFADRCRECGKMRKGHWIYDETIENWRCSKCNETPKTMGYVGTADFMAEHFKFCNHCGAKMESEVNNG